MARILVVSTSSTVSLALATTEHDIVERLPADVESYEADVFVVDLDEPIEAVNFLGNLAVENEPPPALVTIGDTPAWHSVHALDLPRLAVVERPVSRASLLAAVDHLLNESVDHTMTPTPPVIQVPAQAEPISEPVDLTVLERSNPPTPPTTQGSEPVKSPVAEPKVSAAGQRTHKATKPPRMRGRRQVSEAASEPTQPQRTHGRRRAGDVRQEPSSPPSTNPSLSESAHRLAVAAQQLQGLDIVACDAVGRAMAAVDGTAGALLMPDGQVWRTAGGLALRRREWMSELPAEAWLIDLVVGQEKAIVIEDTDIARPRLVNVPLARCRNLLAVPLPTVHGALLVGRDDDAFGPDDLQAVAEAAREAETDLGAALLLRDVADALHRFAERRSL